MRQLDYVGLGTLLLACAVPLPACGSDESSPGTTASSGGAPGSGGASAGGKASAGGASAGGKGAGGSSGGSGSGGASAGGRNAGGALEAGVPDASEPDGSVPDAGNPDADVSDAGSGGAGSGGAGSGGAAGGSSVATCGSSPYARIWVGGSTLLDHPTGEITVSGSTCTGSTFGLTPKKPGTNPGKTGIDAAFFDVPNLAPIHLRATQASSFTFLGQEFIPDKDSIVAKAFGYAVAQNAGMVATDSGFTALDPSWNVATRAMLFLQIAILPGAAGACANQSGITVVVDGHPEATTSNGVKPIVTVGGNTGAIVYLTTSGTPTAAELLTLTLTKTGCTAKTTGYESSPGLATSYTGKFPVEPGAVTWGLVALGN